MPRRSEIHLQFSHLYNFFNGVRIPEGLGMQATHKAINILAESEKNI